MRVIVTGGAGYIGSVVTEELLKEGHQVAVYDNLSEGHREAIPSEAEFIEGDLLDGHRLKEAFAGLGTEAVVHMAARALVGESMTDPALYYQINMTGGLSLLNAMMGCGVKRIVFSSTAAVYGEPTRTPIDESDPKQPTNPYGETKLAFEKAMGWYGHAHGLRHISLRYFNAAGASVRCGEDHPNESHIIPIVLQAAAGKRESVVVYGDDYPTADGTCVRDYIHVIDLARAHVLALSAIDETSGAYNLGCGGSGYSIRELIEVAAQVTGKKIPVEMGPRRPGDPAILIASSDRIRKELGWSPQFQNLQKIVESAWTWLLDHPDGYGS